MSASLRNIEVAVPKDFIGEWRWRIDSIDAARPVTRKMTPPSRADLARDCAIALGGVAAVLLVPGLLLFTNAK